MHLDDRIVIAANDQASLISLYADLKQKAKDYIKEVGQFDNNLDQGSVTWDDAPEHPLSALLSAAQANDERTTSHAKKLEDVFNFTRGLLDESNIAAVETLRQHRVDRRLCE